MLLAGILGIAFWLLVLLTAARLAKRIPALPPVASAAANETDLVSVIVPARNEEKDVERAIRSLLDQTYSNLEVIAINDHSTDATGAILNRLRSENHRLQVVHDPLLQEGWLGKPNAQSHGARRACGKWLVFVDADIVLEESTIERTVATVQAQQLDGLTLIPKFITGSWPEAGMLPMLPLGMITLRPDTANTEGTKGGFAAGAFILIAREAYDRVGGHASVKSDVIDDVAFGRVLKRLGANFRAFTGFDAAKVRMYYGARSLLWGLVKNVSFVLGGRRGHPFGALAGSVVACSLVSLPAAILVAGSVSGTAAVALAGLIGFAMPLLFLFGARSFVEYRFWHALLYPVAVWIIVLATVVASYYRISRGTILWRDREVQLAP